MKVSEYIKLLQDLKTKHGDVDVTINNVYECEDLSINDTYEEAKEPTYSKKHKCISIAYNFITFD